MSSSFDPADLASIPDLPAGSFRPPAEPPTVPSLERGPTRETLARRRRVALVAGLVWLAVLVFLFGLRHDLGASWLVVVHAIVPAALGAAALTAALSPGPRGLGPSATTTVALALGAPVAFALSSAFFPHVEGGHDAKSAFFCGDVGLLLGAVPLAALAWAQRRTCVTAAPWRSALLGVAMGLAAAGALGMHCANGDGLHVAIGHGWPVIVLGVAGFLLVGRVTRVR